MTDPEVDVPSPWPERKRRARYVFGIVLALAGLIGGSLYAYQGYVDVAGPTGIVRGYFAAILRNDAAAALGYGTMPTGQHDLLTGNMLREQHHIAPITDVKVGAGITSGGVTTVRVTYSLHFPAGVQHVVSAVPVRRNGESWRLVQSAVPVQLQMNGAQRRATILHTPVPETDTSLFPGALPIRFDSTYLALAKSTDDVHFGPTELTELSVVVTPQARAAVATSVATALDQCVTNGTIDPQCPLPSGSYVPGSFDGKVTGDLATRLHVQLSADPDGAFQITGTVPFVGSYRKLAFDNVASTVHGTLPLTIEAVAYAVDPLVIRFGGST
jgi:hypothetical protein